MVVVEQSEHARLGMQCAVRMGPIVFVIREFVLRTLCETDQCVFKDGRALRNLCRRVRGNKNQRKGIQKGQAETTESL